MSHSTRKKQPSVIEMTRLTAGSTRANRRRSSWYATAASAGPSTTRPSPEPYMLPPTTCTHSVLVPGFNAAAGRKKTRGVFQLRLSGSTRLASRQSRLSFSEIAPAMLR
ncbi:hypothetical protein D3C87_1077680 [compost metagenome]